MAQLILIGCQRDEGSEGSPRRIPVGRQAQSSKSAKKRDAMESVDPWDNEKTRGDKVVYDALYEALYRAGLDVIDDVLLIGRCEHNPHASISLGRISVEDAEAVVHRLEEPTRIAHDEGQHSEKKLKKAEEKLAKLQG
jgi:hypothetical protein